MYVSFFSIKQCTEITEEDFVTVHHEMGHVEYYMQYKNQPFVYRDGANPGNYEFLYKIYFDYLKIHMYSYTMVYLM